MYHQFSSSAKLSCLILSSIFIFFSCGGSSAEVILKKGTSDNKKVDSTIILTPSIDTLVDDIASIIAGLKPMVFTNKKIPVFDRLTYRVQVEKDWATVVKHKIN